MSFKEYLKGRLKEIARWELGKPEVDPYVQAALEEMCGALMLGGGVGAGIAWGISSTPWYGLFLLLVPAAVLLLIHSGYLRDVKGKEKVRKELEERLGKGK